MSQDNESSPQSEIAETGAISTEDKNVAAKSEERVESPADVVEAATSLTKENSKEEQPEELQPQLIVKVVTILLRIIVGGVFIASGFTKAIDPWGFIYKIEDYLNVWGVGVPRSIIVVGAVGLSAYEFLFGAMLALGAYRRTSVRALMLTMLFMLPLTAYIAIANPVADCGCFGEWLLLSNWATFGKNILITAMLVWLWRYNYSVKWAFVRPSLQWVAATACAIYLIIIAGYGYMVQPLIDFRPYPVGKSPWQETDNEVDLARDAIFIYEKDGVTAQFTIDNLPDSTWEFVERQLPASVSETTGSDTSIALYDGDEEVTYIAEEAESPVLLITIPEPENVDIATIYPLNELSSIVQAQGGTTFALISGSEAARNAWADISMADYDMLSCEDTSLKSMVRGNPGVVIIEDGAIKLKRSASSIPVEWLEQVHSEDDFAQLLDKMTISTTILPNSTYLLAGILLILIIASLKFNKFTRKSKKNS